MLITHYKMRSVSSREVRTYSEEDFTCTDMAPCSNSFSSLHHIRISEKDNIKLRKPIVEKMRRDRINSCIEQLKIILEKEFHKQEPNSKLEKADILEMTVGFLRQQLQPGLCHSDYNQGYPASPLQGLQQQEQQLHQTQRASSSSPICSTLRPTTLQDSSSSRGSMWRPW
ncbi:transcription factor HES-5-like [Centropristis striata]|uniref:transcription factor HES-5-like n=1 Tax=Centropristis striata TaxID=184440 RepID=UPI0027E01841|nr:transcription factor HES-5-like [Centropristis striata]